MQFKHFISSPYPASANTAMQQESTVSNGNVATGAQQGNGYDGMTDHGATSATSTFSIGISDLRDFDMLRYMPQTEILHGTGGRREGVKLPTRMTSCLPENSSGCIINTE